MARKTIEDINREIEESSLKIYKISDLIKELENYKKVNGDLKVKYNSDGCIYNISCFETIDHKGEEYLVMG